MSKIIIIFIFSISLFASNFLIMTEDLKPYNYIENNKIVGISTDVVQKVMENLGYPEEEILIYPWSRAVKILDTNKKAILYSMSYTKERALKYKFACPLSKNKVYIFTRKDSNLDIKTLDDLKGLKIGVVQDFGAHKYLLSKGFIEFDYSSSTNVLAQKLIDGKIDASPSNPFAIGSSKVDVSLLKQSDLLLYDTDLCIAFNPAFSDEEVDKWQKQLQKIHESGEYDIIYNKYIQGIR